MLDKLRENPDTLAADLPGATDWLAKLVGKPITLNPQQAFLDQAVAAVAAANIQADISTWDPYDEGYDEGPGDLSDSWHTNHHVSNGQFSGTVVTCDAVFDALGAAVVALADEPDRYDDNLLKEDWVGPITQAERDKRVAAIIRAEFARLSPVVRSALLAELTASVVELVLKQTR